MINKILERGFIALAAYSYSVCFYHPDFVYCCGGCKRIY